jgi:hypothetical protein
MIQTKIKFWDEYCHVLMLRHSDTEIFIQFSQKSMSGWYEMQKWPKMRPQNVMQATCRLDWFIYAYLGIWSREHLAANTTGLKTAYNTRLKYFCPSEQFYDHQPNNFAILRIAWMYPRFWSLGLVTPHPHLDSSSINLKQTARHQHCLRLNILTYLFLWSTCFLLS